MRERNRKRMEDLGIKKLIEEIAQHIAAKCKH